MKKPSRALKTLLIWAIFEGAVTHTLAYADVDMSADQIKALREIAQQEKEASSRQALTPQQFAERQTAIDSEVRANFQKRVQMRPSDVAAIPPECDEWLKLYQETGWEKARQGIKTKCP